MGNASFSQQPLQDPRAYIQNDLPKFIVQNRLGNGKFMKTYNATIDSSSVVIKVYIKPSDEDLTAVSKRLSHLLRTFSPMIYPNILPYQMWVKSSIKLPKTNATPVYLIRQYLHMNLHDRLSTRPFFNETEKIWIIFQLFKILDICHSSGIMHGDVKPENIMCTSWNYVILTDFASCFKPINIPDDNPTDFQYYYDVMNRQSCYIAPERFQRKNINSNEDYNNISDYGYMESWTPAMDVFSLGCTIAEIWLNGEPLLDLPGMLKYVSQSVDRLDHEDSPARATLNKVNNRLIREVIADMTQRDPERRLSIKQYFDILEGKGMLRNSNTVNESPIFSPYFSECIYPLFTKLHFEGLTPDNRIGIICETYGDLIKSITGTVDEKEKSYFSYSMRNIMYSNDTIDFTSISSIENEKIISSDVEIAKNVAKSLSAESLYASRKRNLVDGQTTMSSLQSKKMFFQNKNLEALSSDASKSFQKEEDHSKLSIDELIKSCRSMIDSSKENKKKEGFKLSAITEQFGKLFKIDGKDTKTKILTNSINVADAAINISYEADAVIGNNPTSKTFFDLSKGEDTVNEAGEYVRPVFQDLSILLQLICSNFRHLKYPHSKVVSLMLLVRVGQRCPDDIILERVIPTLLIALDDLNSVVRATAIRSIRSLIVIVQSFAAFEANIFPQYIFPALNRVAKDPDVIVRSAFAETIGILAETSKRFLDKTHMIVLSKSLTKPASSPTSQSNDQESLNVINFAYDAKLKVLHDQISRWIRDLVMDTGLVDIRQGSGLSSHGSIVKRVLLVDIMRLCTFFGQESTMDLLLTQLLTFLNDQDWELRYAFCAKIASVCAFLGPTVSSDCILPCIENALVDVEEKVVLRAVQCLTNLIELSLLSTLLIVDTVKNVTPLLLHPSKCVRNAAIQLVAAAAKLLGTTDASVVLLPIIKSTLRFDLTGIEIDSKIINLCLLPPLSRRSYRKAILSRQANNGKSVEVPTASNELIEPHTALDSSYSGLVKVKQEAGGGYTLGEEDPEETKKLALMSTYLDAAAREMNTKTIQWKNGITSGTTVGFTASLIRLQSLRESSTLGNIDTLIDPSASIMPEYSVQSLLIPHQKYGQQYYSAKSEDLWSLNIGIGSNQSTLKIRSLYGLSANHVEANRLLKLDQIELLEAREEKKQGDSGRRVSETGLRRRSLQGSSAALDAMLPSPTPLSPTGAPPIPPSENEIQYSNKQNKFLKTSNNYKDSQNLIKKIKALDIPPLPPDVGSCIYFPRDDRFNRDLLDSPSVTDMVSPTSPIATNQNSKNWKPKENAQVASLSEHTRAVNRLAVAPDQSFFASASSDNTVKIWQVKGLDRAAFPRSALTYAKHKGAVFDLAVIENSHSMASCSDDGTIHVWRVDVSGGNNNNNGLDSENSTTNQNLEGGIAAIRSAGLSVSGLSVVKTVDCREGPVLCVQHFNNDIASIIIFVTLKGIIHGWDLRSSKETFNYSLNPELGYPTCMTIAPDRHWLCIGTSKGYLCVWDIRYNILCKIWRHSSLGPIYKIACCKTALKGGSNIFGLNINSNNNNDGVFLSVAAGNNEAGIWSIPDGGECVKCFRSIPLTSSRIPLLSLPCLNDISISKVLRYKNDNIQSSASENFNDKSKSSSESVVKALMGRISSSSSSSYLITAGTDRQIRYWDFTSPMKCYTISGLESAQPKPTFESPLIDNVAGKLIVCYDSHMPTQDTILQSHVPLCENRGPIGVLNNYKDAILDLKSIDTGTYQRLMISCGRDGEIKLWR